MPYVTYESQIRAPTELVWALLCEKAEHPERFYPGLREVEILERRDDGVLRQVTTDDGEVRRERLVTDEERMRISATLFDHPVYSGTAVCQLSLPSDGPLLRCELSWIPHSGAEPESASQLDAMVLAGLKSVIARAEAEDSKGKAASG